VVAIVKVCYAKITYWRGWERTLERVREWLADSAADYVIVVADQTVTDEMVKDAEKLAAEHEKAFYFRDEVGGLGKRRIEGGKPEFRLIRAEFKENIPEFRNKYLEEAERLGVDWVAVSDSDEILNEAFRRDCKKIAEELEKRGYNIAEINCKEAFEDHEWLDDADKLAASIIEPRESWYYKQLFFRLRPSLRYVGAGGLRRVHETWSLKEGWHIARLPRDRYWYTHVKSPLQIWRNAARNMVIGGGGLDVGELNPYWKPLRRLMEKYGFKGWADLEKAILEHRVPEEMVKFFEQCLDAPNTDYGRETRQLAKFFFWHNREYLTDEVLHKIKNPSQPTDEQKVVDWIVRCYLEFLGRHPDPESLEYWKRRIMTGQTPMHELPLYLKASHEYAAKMASERELKGDVEFTVVDVPVRVHIELTEETIFKAIRRSKLWNEELKPCFDVGKFVLEAVSDKKEFLRWFYERRNELPLEEFCKKLAEAAK